MGPFIDLERNAWFGNGWHQSTTKMHWPVGCAEYSHREHRCLLRENTDRRWDRYRELVRRFADAGHEWP